MYRRMLVPLDGSELAEVVFPYIKELAARLDIDVILLQVSGPLLDQFGPMRQAYIEHAVEVVREKIRGVQNDIGTQVGTKPVEVRGELVEGYPAEVILRYAEEKEVDLIVLATHGYSGLKRWRLGSVASKVLSASKIPIWLIQAGITEAKPYDEWPSTTLLVPLDGSELAESVIPHAEILAKQRGVKPVEVILLRVAESPAMPSYFGPELSGMSLNWGEYVQQEEVRRKKLALEYLDKIEKQLKNSDISVRSEVVEGKASDEIINIATKNPFIIIVMATHGRSGLGRLVYGSVAATLLNSVTCPIFLVKPK
jgi:nucleotide-binding universal stress UspA family protein